MRREIRLVILALPGALALALGACKPQRVSLQQTDTGTLGDGGAGGSDGGNPALDGGGGHEDPTTGRVARRLSVAQLRAAFPVVFGNDKTGTPITWMVGTKPGWDVYSRTLGEPDYVNVTDENREPSPLYVKFMDDAARDACDKALTADFARPDPSTRAIVRWAAPTDTIATNAAGIDKTLRYLRLRFHGLHVADGDDAPISELRTLFGAAVQANAGSTLEGWRAVCVALTAAPEFSLY